MSTDETDLERWAAAAAWSDRPELGPVESVMWRAERHPEQSATSCILIDLDREPDWERFAEATEWATRLVRRLRQRVLEPALPTTAPRWVDDEHFSLGYHLRRQSVGGSGSRHDLLKAAQLAALTPFDRTRPLWEAVLFTGLEGGGASYLLKIHHTLADGLGTVRLLSLLQSRTRRHTADKPTAPAPATAAPADPVALAREGVLRDVLALPARTGAAVRTGVFAARHPRTVLSEGVRYAASMRRLLASAPADPSPLLADRDGRSWQFLTFSCDLSALRAAGQAAGGGLQDAFLAALAGGLRRYHDQHGVHVEDLPVTIRVSLDRADDPMSGNRFAGAMIAAPVGMTDPAERVAAVRGEALSLHTETALGALRSLAPVATRLPAELVALLVEQGAVADLAVATLPGPTRATYMAGARVTGMYPFAPLPGVAVAATLLSLDDTACLGLNVDGAAVVDLPGFEQAMREGLDEVLALA